MSSIRKIALKRIKRLFELAKEMSHDDPELAQRYVNIARRIAMRARVRLPREYRRMICRKCKSFIIPFNKGGSSKSSDGWLPNYFVPIEYYIDWSTNAVKLHYIYKNEE